MLGRILERLGLFVGSRKDENNEALFFQDINKWLLAQCGARWDNPNSIEYLWLQDDALTTGLEYVRHLMQSPRAEKFLGLAKYFQYRDIARLHTPWGWKDPRNTFTLPFWQRIFPNLKIIYMERHGVDVAQSLCARSAVNFQGKKSRYKKYEAIAWLRLKRGGFLDSPRCATIDGAFSLWKDYQIQAKAILARMPKTQTLCLRYEDFLSSPVEEADIASRFCGLEPGRSLLQTSCKGININRAFAYTTDQKLVVFARDHVKELRSFGYSAGGM